MSSNLLVHTPNAHNIRCLSRPKTGAQNSIWVPSCDQNGPHDPAYPIVIEVSAVDRDDGWRIQLFSIGELQWKSLGFWKKALSSFAENFPLERHFWFATGLLNSILGHQITMWLEFPIMNWVLSYIPSQKGRCAEHFIHRVEVYIWSNLSRPWRHKLHEEMDQIPLVCTHVTLLSLS